MPLLILITLLIGSVAQAEYRVFLLRIGETNSPNYRLVKSTLDPLQYRGYYSLKQTEVVEYIDTWMCKGSTSQFRPLCEKTSSSTPPPSEG